MSPQRENATSLRLERFRKLWPRLFIEDRNPNEPASHVELKHRINLDSAQFLAPRTLNCSPTQEHISPTSLPNDPDRQATESGAVLGSKPETEPDRLAYFLRDYDGDPTTCEEEEIAKFCHGRHPSILHLRDGMSPKTAWLDDRAWLSRPSGPMSCDPTSDEDNEPPENDSEVLFQSTLTENNFSPNEFQYQEVSDSSGNLAYREYEAPLSAAALFGYLDRERFGHTDLPDADRRLIFISDLSPAFVFALTETAPEHQVASLKDAFFKHLAGQTSIGVKISTNNFTTFQMHFHIPFYTLNKCKPKEYSRHEVYLKPQRTWIDLSFLATQELKVQHYGTLGIHEAHLAFTICGVADRRWVAYAFVDTDYDDDQQMSNFEFDYDSIVVDQIASNGKVNANYPIWNPREYFLLVISVRMKQIVSEWARLIRTIEKGIRKHTDGPPSVQAFRFSERGDGYAMATFDRTQKELELLGALHDELSGVNKAWKRFTSLDGDIGYLTDFRNVLEASQEKMQASLNKINEYFEDLEDLQRRLEILQRRCQKTANILELSLTLESNKAAKLSGYISELMVSWVSPVAIVSAFFAIPEPFGSFPRNGKAFTAAIIVVFIVLQLLIFMKRGRLRVQSYWKRILHKDDKDIPSGLTFRDKINRLRRKRSHADTEAT